MSSLYADKVLGRCFMLKFQNVTYQIPNGQVIYQDLSLEVGGHEFFGILGKNGAGKSTLIEMIMGMRKLKKGSITVFGEDPIQSTRLNKDKIFETTSLTLKFVESINTESGLTLSGAMFLSLS